MDLVAPARARTCYKLSRDRQKPSRKFRAAGCCPLTLRRARTHVHTYVHTHTHTLSRAGTHGNFPWPESSVISERARRQEHKQRSRRGRASNAQLVIPHCNATVENREVFPSAKITRRTRSDSRFFFSYDIARSSLRSSHLVERYVASVARRG